MVLPYKGKRMMRENDLKRETLYQFYFQVVSEGLNIHKDCQDRKKLNIKIWEEITKEGFWKIPVPEEYGGFGLPWQEFALALEGVVNAYFNSELFSAMINQVSAIYLLTQHSSGKVKKEYLHYMLEGINVCMIVPDIKRNFCYIKRPCLMLEAIKRQQNILFQISKVDLLLLDSSKQKNVTKFEIIDKEKGQQALYDLLNFERLLHGIVLSEIVAPYIKETQDLIKEYATLYPNKINQKINYTIKNLSNQKKLFYTLLSKLTLSCQL